MIDEFPIEKQKSRRLFLYDLNVRRYLTNTIFRSVIHVNKNSLYSYYTSIHKLSCYLCLCESIKMLLVTFATSNHELNLSNSFQHCQKQNKSFQLVITRFNLRMHRLIELDEHNLQEEMVKVLPQQCPFYHLFLLKDFP